MKAQVAAELGAARDEGALWEALTRVCEKYGAVGRIGIYRDQRHPRSVTCLVTMADTASLQALVLGTGACPFGYDSAVFSVELARPLEEEATPAPTWRGRRAA